MGAGGWGPEGEASALERLCHARHVVVGRVSVRVDDLLNPVKQLLVRFQHRVVRLVLGPDAFNPTGPKRRWRPVEVLKSLIENPCGSLRAGEGQNEGVSWGEERGGAHGVRVWDRVPVGVGDLDEEVAAHQAFERVVRDGVGRVLIVVPEGAHGLVRARGANRFFATVHGVHVFELLGEGDTVVLLRVRGSVVTQNDARW
mmetsp:Transcript_13722/g.40675  ORF Transcript_13722/g.40675 Transcript_13722/m.40675 type:complete len:200 (+) Transcript_13722:1014-1613(+)